mmetsp:Transcript_35909/g.99259  ORF Transcript_35909/g.99259 Transcript_35909/m.99259 type:complete len:367 (+) Transcript_35909:467-1567(+)
MRMRSASRGARPCSSSLRLSVVRKRARRKWTCSGCFPWVPCRALTTSSSPTGLCPVARGHRTGQNVRGRTSSQHHKLSCTIRGSMGRGVRPSHLLQTLIWTASLRPCWRRRRTWIASLHATVCSRFHCGETAGPPTGECCSSGTWHTGVHLQTPRRVKIMNGTCTCEKTTHSSRHTRRYPQLRRRCSAVGPPMQPRSPQSIAAAPGATQTSCFSATGTARRCFSAKRTHSSPASSLAGGSSPHLFRGPCTVRDLFARCLQSTHALSPTRCRSTSTSRIGSTATLPTFNAPCLGARTCMRLRGPRVTSTQAIASPPTSRIARVQNRPMRYVPRSPCNNRIGEAPQQLYQKCSALVEGECASLERGDP